MFLTNLIIPLSIINATILITLVIFLVKTAIKAVDALRDLTPILYVLTKQAHLKFRVKQQVEDVATKNFIVTVAYIALIVLILHSIINMITVKSKGVCWKLSLFRIFCEHATSMIRIFFCLLGCLIFTAIAAADLTVCMPTPTFPLMAKQTIYSKAYAGVNKLDFYIPGSNLPNTKSMKIEKRSIRRSDYTICDYCEKAPNKLPKICSIYNEQKISRNNYVFGTLFHHINISVNMDEIVGVTIDDQLILSCDSGRNFVPLGLLTTKRKNANRNKENERKIRDATDGPTEESTEPVSETENPYDNILMDRTLTHHQQCQKMQSVLSKGLLLTALVLTCLNVILLLSRYERDPCICGYRERQCLCEIRVCSCRARGAGSSVLSKTTAYTSKTTHSINEYEGTYQDITTPGKTESSYNNRIRNNKSNYKTPQTITSEDTTRLS